jgi:predicted nucleic acid-binding protein
MVVDANVIAKWILSGEPYEDNALRLKEDVVNRSVILHSPDLLLSEVGNVFWKASKKSRISNDNAIRALGILATMNIVLHRLRWEETIEALQSAIELNLTVYDASYLYLGKVLGASVLTGDEKLWKSAKEKYDVTHLKDY